MRGHCTLFERLDLSLAWQFLTHTTNGFARFVTWVSFIGLTLGVMILTMVVTVMNGFDSELKSRLLSSIPHITVPQADVQPELEAVVARHPNVQSSTNYFQGLGALVAYGRVFPVTLLGVAEQDVLFAGKADEAVARLQRDRQGILLGQPLARAIGLAPGGQVSLITVQVSGNAVAPEVLNFTSVGTFEIGAEPDYTLAVVNLSRFATATWGAMGEVGLRIQPHNPLNAAPTIQEFKTQFPEIQFTSWQKQYGGLFRAVQLEKSMMFVLLFLVVAIAAFNIIAGQSMLVNDKRRSIAILRTMGCDVYTIRRVFLLQGTLISTFGTAIGLLLGIWTANYINEILAIIEQVSGMHLLDGSLFVEVPTLVMYQDLAFIATISLALCWLAAWVPASRAAAIDPVVALH